MYIAYLYNGIQLSKKREHTTDTYNVNETQKYYAE